MCPPRPVKTVEQILMEACAEVARRHPELLFPNRYYDADDQADWVGV